MIICATDLALLYFGDDAPQRENLTHHAGDTVYLIAQMIEFQHYNIGLSAVDTGMGH